MRRAAAIGFAACMAVAALLGLSGCAQTPKAPPAVQPPDITGAWVLRANEGQRAALSDLTLEPDGTFAHTGLNALGGKVTFAGRYEVGRADGANFLRMSYDDYPVAPKVWYYALDGSQLVLADSPERLRTGPFMRFARVRFSQRQSAAG